MNEPVPDPVPVAGQLPPDELSTAVNPASIPPPMTVLSSRTIAKITGKAMAKEMAKAAAKAAARAAISASPDVLPAAMSAAAQPVPPVIEPAVQVIGQPASLPAVAPAATPPLTNSAKSTTGGATNPSPSTSNADLAALLGEPAALPWYRRPLWWTLAVLVLLVAGGVWWWMDNAAKNAVPTYNTQVVARSNLTLTVTANGTLQPTRAINIGSELSGTVSKVNVDVNDRIKKGDVLVVLDTAKLNDQILRSGATLSAARAKVELTAATIKEATANMGRLDAVAVLSGGKVPSKAELDTARATLARANADHASALAGVTDAQAALSTDQTNLSKASIRAPADGVVLTRNVDPGNAVAASFQAVTLFTVAEDLTKLRLWVYVDEADVSAVKVGQNASFTVSAYLARRFPARITRVGFGSTITDNVVTYLTYLDVDNADLSLRPGMTATASIVATERKDVLVVPNTALRFSPTVPGAAAAAKKGISLLPRMPGNNTRRSAAEGASTATARQVWVLRDGVAVAVAVTPGISDGHMTEITGGDLQAGMLVITDQKSATAK